MSIDEGIGSFHVEQTSSQKSPQDGFEIGGKSALVTGSAHPPPQKNTRLWFEDNSLYLSEDV